MRTQAETSEDRLAKTFREEEKVDGESDTVGVSKGEESKVDERSPLKKVMVSKFGTTQLQCRDTDHPRSRPDTPTECSVQSLPKVVKGV